ncbi:unnamed protein product [Boreogadus saida]
MHAETAEEEDREGHPTGTDEDGGKRGAEPSRQDGPPQAEYGPEGETMEPREPPHTDLENLLTQNQITSSHRRREPPHTDPENLLTQT